MINCPSVHETMKYATFRYVTVRLKGVDLFIGTSSEVSASAK